MFEKEAEEYREQWQNKGYYFVSQEMEQIELDDIVDATFKDGAEFGYNKANEWHYVKDGDLPKISDSTIRTLKPVIVAVVNGIETSTYGTYWNVHTGKFECLDEVYAWCYTPESPELPKE